MTVHRLAPKSTLSSEVALDSSRGGTYLDYLQLMSKEATARRPVPPKPDISQLLGIAAKMAASASYTVIFTDELSLSLILSSYGSFLGDFFESVEIELRSIVIMEILGLG